MWREINSSCGNCKFERVQKHKVSKSWKIDWREIKNSFPYWSFPRGGEEWVGKNNRHAEFTYKSMIKSIFMWFWIIKKQKVVDYVEHFVRT